MECNGATLIKIEGFNLLRVEKLCTFVITLFLFVKSYYIVLSKGNKNERRGKV